MDKVHRAQNFCICHQMVLGYSIVSLLTAGSEYIFSSVVFKRPCNSGNLLYSFIFLFVPAFILFLLGYMVNARTRCLLTSSRPPEKRCSPSAACARYCLLLGPVTARALVAPLTWIAVALLRASFYEDVANGNGMMKDLMCKYKGQDCHSLLVKIPCDEKLWKNISGEFLSLQAQSWRSMFFTSKNNRPEVKGDTVRSLPGASRLAPDSQHHNCDTDFNMHQLLLLPISYLQLKFWKIYLKKEQELFEIKAKEHATNLAERNINCFFEAPAPAPFQTPSNEDWQKISFLHTFCSQEQYYSIIHNYVNTNEGNSMRFGEGDQNPPRLGSVDGARGSESGF